MRSETVRIPYINIARLDQTSSSYTKAMAIVNRVAPAEAQKVAVAAPSSSHKRRRKNSFVELEADSASQGKLYFPDWFADALLPSGEFPSIENFNISVGSGNLSAAMAIAQSKPPITTDSLLHMEYSARSELSAITYRISLLVNSYKHTHSERQKLLDLLRQRNQEPLEGLAQTH